MPKFRITYGLDFRNLDTEIIEADSYDAAVMVAYNNVKEEFESEATYVAEEVDEEDDNA